MYDVMIVGGGPAGITAGIYCARANLKTIIFERESIGGQIASTPSIQNFPGFISINGAEFANNLYEQATNLGVDIVIEEVLDIKPGKIKKVITDDGEYEAKTVIIATGARHRLLNLPNEENLIGKGISFCTSCDGAFFKGLDVAIVGGTGTEIEGLFPGTDISIKASTRRLDVRGDGEAFAFTHRGVVSGNNDGSIGLDDPKKVQEEYRVKEAITNPLSAQKINRCTWFKYVDRNPVLFIYPVYPSNSDDVENVLGDYIKEVGNDPIMGYAIGIPGFGHESDNRSYYTNVVYQNNDGLLDTDEDE